MYLVRYGKKELSSRRGRNWAHRLTQAADRKKRLYKPYRFALPTVLVPSDAVTGVDGFGPPPPGKPGGLSGSQGGSSGINLAISICKHVDVFGAGVFVGYGRADLRYIYYYQRTHARGRNVFSTEFMYSLYDALGVYNHVWY